MLSATDKCRCGQAAPIFPAMPIPLPICQLQLTWDAVSPTQAGLTLVLRQDLAVDSSVTASSAIVEAIITYKNNLQHYRAWEGSSWCGRGTDCCRER